MLCDRIKEQEEGLKLRKLGLNDLIVGKGSEAL